MRVAQSSRFARWLLLDEEVRRGRADLCTVVWRTLLSILCVSIPTGVFAVSLWKDFVGTLQVLATVIAIVVVTGFTVWFLLEGPSWFWEWFRALKYKYCPIIIVEKEK